MSPPRLVLASGSRYRRELLARLGVGFEAASPDTDETPRAGEAPDALAARLAAEKASAVASNHADAWALGSDQVACVEGHLLGKPGTREAAIAQLQAMSGRAVVFHTAISLRHPDGRHLKAIDTTTARLRPLQAAEIERYLDAEAPFDCAGSFKAEGLGISLFEAIESRDPTALVGLPLIATAALLREAGFQVP